jgi:hypothetical protein
MRAHGFFFLALLMGCSAGKGESVEGLTPDSGGTFNLDGGNNPDALNPGDDGGGGSCAAQSYKAEEGFAPVDIVWVVDSSGSMSDEAKRVQDNLNGFSAAMGKAGIDYHVVMITSSTFVNVPPPLGTSPSYKLIDREVGSSEPLKALLDEFPNYTGFLRPLSVLHFVAVTDDESSIGAEDWYNQMRAKVGRAFKVHAISSEAVPISITNPTGACQTGGFGDGAASPGLHYIKLASVTGGLWFSICTSDWSGLFTRLTEEVARPAKLPCVFILPTGTSIDPTKVNVDYTNGAGNKQTLLYVGSKDACVPGGWYYDDPANPTRAVLCDATCSTVSADTGGKVDIALGCATKIK